MKVFIKENAPQEKPYKHYFVQENELGVVEHFPNGCEYMLGKELFSAFTVTEVSPSECERGFTFESLLLEGKLKEISLSSHSDHAESGFEEQPTKVLVWSE